MSFASFALFAFLSAAHAQTSSSVPEAARQKIVASALQVPLSFEANRGQTDKQVRFLSRGSGYTLFLTPGEAVLSLRRPASQLRMANDELRIEEQKIRHSTFDIRHSLHSEIRNPKSEIDVLRLRLLNANPDPHVTGLDAQPGVSHYFLGNDPAKWRTNVSHVGKVLYRSVYPGIDLIYYGTDQRRLEHDFVVAPGADPGLIRFEVDGADSLRLDDDGNLVLHTPGGEVVLQAPVAYQEIGGVRRPVESRFVVDGASTSPSVNDPVGKSANWRLTAQDRSVYRSAVGAGLAPARRFIPSDRRATARVAPTPVFKPPDSGHMAPMEPADGANPEFANNIIHGRAVHSHFVLEDRPNPLDPPSPGGKGEDESLPSLKEKDQGKDLPSPSGRGAGGEVSFALAPYDTTHPLIIDPILSYSTYLGGSGGDRGYGIAVDGSGNVYVVGRWSQVGRRGGRRLWMESVGYPLRWGANGKEVSHIVEMGIVGDDRIAAADEGRDHVRLVG